MGGLFSSLFFSNAALLLGVLGASIPIILHMVYRRKAPKIQFSTLRFLRSATERTSRRRRIREWLLLLMRVAAIALLAIGLAGPIFRTANIGGGGGVSTIIVMDNSFSMGAQREGASVYGIARDGAVNILTDLEGSSQAGVVYAWKQATDANMADTLTHDRNGLAGAIRRGETSVAPRGLAGAIAKAEELLASATNDQREIYVFTDMQKAAWRPLQPPKDGNPPTLIIINSGTGERENIAITDVSFSGGRPAAGTELGLQAKVRNFGERSRKGKAKLYIDRNFVDERAIEVAPDSEALVEFVFAFDTTGPHSGWVELEVNDVLDTDNRRYFAIDIPEKLRVGVVREKEGAVALMDEAYFLIPALNPGMTKDSPIAPERMLRSDLSNKRLSNYRVLFLLNLPKLDAPEVKALTEYLDGGGAVVIFPGDAVDAKAWNALADSGDPTTRGLVPARYGKRFPETVADESDLTLDKIEFRHPIFAPFRDLDPSFFSAVTVDYCFELELDKDSGAIAIARLSNDLPFLVEKRLENGGRVLQFSTSATTRWSNLPTRKLYLPLLHQMTYSLANIEGAGGGIAPGRPIHFRGIAQTDTIPEIEPRPSPIHVANPRGGSAQAAVYEVGARYPTFAATYYPGVYTWANQKDRSSRGAFVVNPATDESDLTLLTEKEIQETMLAGREAHFVRNSKEASAVAERLREGFELQTPLLFLVIGLLILECLLANQTQAHKTPDKVRVTAAGATI
jgi:Aerotolerance regulator N-terminal/von Willebrand factor type A domain